MRLTEDEKTAFSKFRNVSELRTLFLCEYRFFLTQQSSQEISKAALEGAVIHQKLALTEKTEFQPNHWRILLLIISIVVLVLLIIW